VRRRRRRRRHAGSTRRRRRCSHVSVECARHVVESGRGVEESEFGVFGPPRRRRNAATPPHLMWFGVRRSLCRARCVYFLGRRASSLAGRGARLWREEVLVFGGKRCSSLAGRGARLWREEVLVFGGKRCSSALRGGMKRRDGSAAARNRAPMGSHRRALWRTHRGLPFSVRVRK